MSCPANARLGQPTTWGARNYGNYRKPQLPRTNRDQEIVSEATKICVTLLTHPVLRLHLFKAQWYKDIWKKIKTLSCWYSLDSSHWVLSDEYPLPRVAVIFPGFLHHFVLTKLATSSIRVNKGSESVWNYQTIRDSAIGNLSFHHWFISLYPQWHRAACIRKEVVKILKPAETFREEKIWSTRAIMIWCRQHSYTPLDPGRNCISLYISCPINFVPFFSALHFRVLLEHWGHLSNSVIFFASDDYSPTDIVKQITLWCGQLNYSNDLSDLCIY